MCAGRLSCWLEARPGLSAGLAAPAAVLPVCLFAVCLSIYLCGVSGPRLMERLDQLERQQVGRRKPSARQHPTGWPLAGCRPLPVPITTSSSWRPSREQSQGAAAHSLRRPKATRLAPCALVDGRCSCAALCPPQNTHKLCPADCLSCWPHTVSPWHTVSLWHSQTSQRLN